VTLHGAGDWIGAYVCWLGFINNGLQTDRVSMDVFLREHSKIGYTRMYSAVFEIHTVDKGSELLHMHVVRERGLLEIILDVGIHSIDLLV